MQVSKNYMYYWYPSIRIPEKKCIHSILIPTWTETRGPISTAIATRTDYQVRWVQSLPNWVHIPITRTPENTVRFDYFHLILRTNPIQSWTLRAQPDMDPKSGSFRFIKKIFGFQPIIWTSFERRKAFFYFLYVITKVCPIFVGSVLGTMIPWKYLEFWPKF